MTLQTIQELRGLEGNVGKQVWAAAISSADCFVICINRNGELMADEPIATFGDETADAKRADYVSKLCNNAKALLDMAEWALSNGYPQLTARDGGEVQ